ncbi:histidine phosphatase family protein [Schleiferilactobacillus perolens]|jgi:2,3-bisphosphoglycerate-dependent phosphoglycerate mutase|uniref:histidine phosphatase family protein n=1 Tax=Schleiferilactobacillus perolens TaxID=100468 RepID=UPI0023568FB2|nr:histidine phosphatase family protein [Schleiferilactobacillus perolens]MCI2170499.1 histidine phosphatase family protein [Schleiferilactobacillus perolens]
MTRTIYFIRHGEPDTSVHDDQTRPLTPYGQQQAQQLMSVFHDLEITAVYASPFQRAVDTVTPLAKDHGLSVHQSDQLKERQMPGWVANFDQYVDRQWQDLDFAETGGESIHTVQARYLAFLQQLPPTGTFIIGSHGTAMSSIVQYSQPGQGKRYFQSLQGHYAKWFKLLELDGRPVQLFLEE